jgi:hypothetical protein
MKSSELIDILQNHIKVFGDCDVCINHWGAIYSDIDVKFRKFLNEVKIDITPPMNEDLKKPL